MGIMQTAIGVCRSSAVFIDKITYALARNLAIFGGFIVLFIALLSCISILGRGLLSLHLVFLEKTNVVFGPLPGTFELVEHLTALAVFAFLPWCHLARAHVRIDSVVDFLCRTGGVYSVRVLTTWVSDCIIILFAVLIMVYIGLAAFEKADLCWQSVWQCETTPILGIPLWYGYVIATCACVVHVLVAITVLGQDIVMVLYKTRTEHKNL